MKLAFIGAGKMATALAQGLTEGNVLTRDEVSAADIAPGARARFAQTTGVRCAASATAIIDDATAILLAVKPQCAQSAAVSLSGRCTGKLLISIAAGLPLPRLRAWFGTDRIVRVMPNTPLMVGQGASVYACTAAATDSDRELVRRIFGTLGLVLEMPEDRLDAVTALSGSGPAYVFEFIQALVDAAVDAGLPPDAALSLTVQTVSGAAEMLRRNLGTPDALRTAVTSPGGTTAAALEVLERRGFRALLAAAFAAARTRSAELGQAG